MTLDVGRLVLVRGSNEAGAGFSAMEAVAFAAGEAWSERPRCASPTITEWMIAWNDGLDDADRQELRRYIWRLVGSKGTPAQERSRRWMVADWLVRAYAPAWLESAGLVNEAHLVASLPPLRGVRDLAAAEAACAAAARPARLVRDAAWQDAGLFEWGTAGAVWSAISDATWAAAGSASRAVIWSSTDAMGPGTSITGLWDLASEAASDAAGAIAWRAVRHSTAGWDLQAVGAEQDDGAAALARRQDADPLWGLIAEAARRSLAPAGMALQASAHVLVDRMLAVTEAHNPTLRPFDSPRPRDRHRLPRRLRRLG